MRKWFKKRSPWMKGLLFAEELVHLSGDTQSVTMELDNPFDFSEFDRGGLDYCRYFHSTLKRFTMPENKAAIWPVLPKHPPNALQRFGRKLLRTQ